ncbi:hypothetical protein C2G38_2251154 [Gigaspora rosea]|uniref:Uncharacterized protein n=1 Tax=Gigaspora rosea TaxID=44941 RepID=A0A397UHM0_9GLOM|nr:hypothetical protein C2G38_2251154 [Gigaspora rosea]
MTRVARGESGDGGQDIIVEVQIRGREEADAFLTVVRRGNFDFGVLVGVCGKKIASGAYDAAEDSKGDIIDNTRLLAEEAILEKLEILGSCRSAKQIHTLENRNNIYDNIAF